MPYHVHFFVRLCFFKKSFFLLRRPPPRSTLFPYTTLFRSGPDQPPDDPRRPQRPGLQDQGRQVVSGDHLPSLRSEEHTSELESRRDLVCRLLLEKKDKILFREMHRHLLIAAYKTLHVIQHS